MLTVVVRDRVLKAGLKLGNIYGPTETTVCCVFDEVDETMTDPTIIGRPYGENRVYILDDELRMVPHGAVGTLWIAGPQVSKGYLGRPDLTEASFRPDPFFPGERMYNSGDLCAWVERGFLKCYGRADQQVKIRGQRIEILEIEMAITRVPDVFNACVVKRVKDGREDLVGFYSIKVRLSIVMRLLLLILFSRSGACHHSGHCRRGTSYIARYLRESSCLYAAFDVCASRETSSDGEWKSRSQATRPTGSRHRAEHHVPQFPRIPLGSRRVYRSVLVPRLRSSRGGRSFRRGLLSVWRRLHFHHPSRRCDAFFWPPCEDERLEARDNRCSSGKACAITRR